MTLQRYLCNVSRLNNIESTMVVPGDTFNFDIKVIYHSISTPREGLSYLFPSSSISCHELFQEGQRFLPSLLSGTTGFTIESFEEMTQGFVSAVRELFHEGSDDVFLALESENRVIPLSVRILIVDYRMNGGGREEREYCRENDAKMKRFLKECRVMRGSEDCSICLEELNMNGECYTMPCHHAFHLPCILSWLKTRPLCPLCRYSLPTL